MTKQDLVKNILSLTAGDGEWSIAQNVDTDPRPVPVMELHLPVLQSVLIEWQEQNIVKTGEPWDDWPTGDRDIGE